MPDLQDAISLLEKGNAREASVVLKTMAAEMPGYATARVLLARSYEGLGDWGGALAAWREAMHIVPNSPVILRGLERVARKAASGATAEELPSVTVSTPATDWAESDDATEWAEPDEADVRMASDVHPDVDERADRDPESAPPLEPDPESEHVQDLADDRDLAEERGVEQDQDISSHRDPGEDRDLDRLIAELESARIVPRPDLDTLPEPELDDDIEDVVSVTLARIYASQGQYDEAARVYDLLAVQQSDDEAAYKAKAEEMRSKASEE